MRPPYRVGVPRTRGHAVQTASRRETIAYADRAFESAERHALHQAHRLAEALADAAGALEGIMPPRVESRLRAYRQAKLEAQAALRALDAARESA